MAWTLCTSGSAIHHAGAALSGSYISISGSALADYSDQAEAFACVITRSNVIGNYGSLTANGKKVLQEYACAHIAQKMIEYEYMNVMAKNDAITQFNMLETVKQDAVKYLSDDKFRTYLGVS